MEINITILFQIIFFLMLMLILKRFLFHPIISLIDKRKQIISKEKNEYLSLCKLIDKQKNKIEVRLNTAKQEAVKEIEKLKFDGAKQSRELIDHARNQARADILDARKDLSEEMKKITKSLEEEADILAKEILFHISNNNVKKRSTGVSTC